MVAYLTAIAFTSESLYCLDCYSNDVSVTRSYASAKREAQARETRRSILDAAHELFVGTGYAATTIQAIADRAGVAVQTVYAVFGNKRELLRQLIERTITGDDEPLSITERVEAQSIAAEPDARRRAALDAALSRTITERVAPIVRVAGEMQQPLIPSWPPLWKRSRLPDGRR